MLLDQDGRFDISNKDADVVDRFSRAQVYLYRLVGQVHTVDVIQYCKSLPSSLALKVILAIVLAPPHRHA